MRIVNKFRGTRGFGIAYERLLRFRYMITSHTEERVRILAFWEKHGLAATQEAFHVSRRTLFRWQEVLRKNQGKIASLTPKKTIPQNKEKENPASWTGSKDHHPENKVSKTRERKDLCVSRG